MTVTITEPAAISVTATAENAYAVSMATGSSIPVTVSIPNKGDKGDPGVYLFNGTGSPPDPEGLPDGSLFFKYEV